MTAPPIDVLTVASWFPSRADVVAGRFVADQVAAIAAHTRVRPSVATFDPADLIGSGGLRSRIATTIADQTGAAVRTGPGLFIPIQIGRASIPVARLAIGAGRHPASRVTHAADARSYVLAALADRWIGGAERDVPRPAIVHAHTGYPDGVAAARLAASLGCPIVITEHSSAVGRQLADPATRAAYLGAAGAASRLVAVSGTLRGELEAAIPELADRLVVIPNAVDLDDFRQDAAEPRRTGELLFVGYRKPSKGIDTLLEAMASLRASRPDVTLRLIGGSPTRDIERQWEQRVEQLGLRGVVSLEGPGDRHAVAAAMRRADLFVHPSPRETFGVVAVEALASGLPVVATDSGGVTEILGDDPDALGGLAPAEQPHALAAVIEAALERRATYDPPRLRAAVAERFGADRVAARIAALYDEVLEERARQAPSPAGGGLSAAIAGTRSAEPGPAAGMGARIAATRGRAQPATTTATPRRVIVALDPGRAAQLASLGWPEASAFAVVTSDEANLRELSSTATVITARTRGLITGLSDAAVLRAGRGRRGRLRRVLRHPLAVARRRGWLPGLERVITGAGSTAIGRAIEYLAADGQSGPIEIVCADGADRLAAAAFLDHEGVVISAGGLRRLGDELGFDLAAPPSTS